MIGSVMVALAASATPKILVNELFDTIQGEASWAGTPSTFVRLHECPVGCTWCDTKYTWYTKPNKEISLGEVIAKDRNSIQYASVMPQVLLDELTPRNPPHVVLTGGEPCLYDLRVVTSALIVAGKSVQIETSGTHKIQASDQAWVTVSPKYDMPGGFKVRKDCLQRANEIKLPVNAVEDLENARRLKDTYEVPVWLQPVSQGQEATQLCVDASMQEGFKVSVQVHKYLGVR